MRQPHFALAPLTLAASLVAFLSGPAHAQSLAATPVAITIAAQPLGSALNELARQAGLQLFFPSALVAGKTASGVSGTLPPNQAVDRLLAGSGLIATQEGNAIVIKAAPPPAEAATLAPVTVTATAERSGTTEGTGSYAARGPSSLATGLPLTLRETPQSVTVMTRQRMDDFQLNTVSDVLDQTPGVHVSRRGNFTEFRARGSLVNLKIDGARQMTDGWGVTSYSMNSLDDMAAIDRIEVLKGSSGLTSGDGYPGATVNLVRKRPTHEFQASVGPSAGSWDSYRTDADVSGPLNESGTLRGRIVAAASDAGSFRDYEKSSNRLLFGTLDLDITPDTLLNVGASYSERELRGSSGTAPIQAYSATGAATALMPRSFNIATPWAGYEQDTAELFASLEHRFAGGWTATARASQQESKTPLFLSGAITRDSLTTALDASAAKNFTNRNQSASIDLKGPVQLFGRTHDLMFGADLAKFDADSDNSMGGATATLASLGSTYAAGGAAIPLFFNPDQLTYGHNQFSSKRTSVYAAGRFNIADPVKLITGLRVTDYKKLDVTPYWWNYNMNEHGVVTPYAGLVVDVSKNVSLYGSYASIFQPQSAQTEDGRTLDPEEGKTYEVGAKGDFFDKRLNASLAYFWMKTDNTAESTGGRTPTNGTAYRAVSGATRRGYELEVSGELSRGWQVQGSYAMNSSSLNSSSRFPKQQFKVGTTYRFSEGALQNLTMGAATRWQSTTSVGSGRLKQAAYWLVDLTARYQVNKQLSIGANINNLFDKHYFSDVWSSSNVLLYTWGRPRSVNVSMRYVF
jgi:outer membrane receptor for ferric coprogen and ferric-rhodotorulic acid